jgi:hypothetical protein
MEELLVESRAHGWLSFQGTKLSFPKILAFLLLMMMMTESEIIAFSWSNIFLNRNHPTVYATGIPIPNATFC